MGNNLNLAASLLPASSPSKARGAALLSIGSHNRTALNRGVKNRVCRAASDSAPVLSLSTIAAPAQGSGSLSVLEAVSHGTRQAHGANRPRVPCAISWRSQ